MEVCIKSCGFPKIGPPGNTDWFSLTDSSCVVHWFLILLLFLLVLYHTLLISGFTLSDMLSSLSLSWGWRLLAAPELWHSHPDGHSQRLLQGQQTGPPASQHEQARTSWFCPGEGLDLCFKCHSDHFCVDSSMTSFSLSCTQVPLEPDIDDHYFPTVDTWDRFDPYNQFERHSEPDEGEGGVERQEKPWWWNYFAQSGVSPPHWLLRNV